MENKKMFLWIALIITAIIPAYSQQPNPESDFKVKKEGNGITITGYVGKRADVVIPGRIQNLPVIGIDSSAFFFCFDLTSITIPDSVINIGEDTFSSNLSLTVINVNPSNTAYSSQDGVLYNKNKTILLKHPAEKTGAFTIPNIRKTARFT